MVYILESSLVSPATARRRRPSSRRPAHAQPPQGTEATVCGEAVLSRRHVEIESAPARVRVGEVVLERLLVHEERATCARHAKSKSPK